MCEKISLNNTDFSWVGYIGNFPVQKWRNIKFGFSDLFILIWNRWLVWCRKRYKFINFPRIDIYNNKNEDMIKVNSLIVYEIKSGDQEKKSWLKQWWKNAILFINI